MAAAAAGDIAAALAYQIKKEIAENYFGVRKTLEEEREDLITQMDQLLKAWEQDVLPYLARISYYLVNRESEEQFLILIHQEEWSDSLKAIQENRESREITAACSPGFALTVSGKYQQLVLALYREAGQKAGPLIETLNSLQKKAGLFNEELAEFQDRFNLLDILAFVKSIESKDDLKGVLGENTDLRAIPALERAMVIHPIDFTGEIHPRIRPLPPLADIKKSFEHLLTQTFHNHCSEVKNRLKKD